MRTLFHTCCSLLAVFILPGLYVHINAQTTWDTPEELQEMITEMKANFPKLKELHQMDKNFEYRRDLARGAYFPIVGANLGYQYMFPVSEFLSPTGEMIPIFPNHNYSAQIYVNHPIWDFGKTKANIDKVDNEQLQLEHNIAFTESNLSYQLANLYYTILFLEKSLAIQDSEMVAAKLAEDLTLKRYKAGDALEVDLLNTRVRIDQISNKRTDIHTGLDKQRGLLSYLSGMDLSEFKIDANMDFPGDDALESLLADTTFERNSDVVSSIDKLLLSKNDLALTSKMGYPTLAFQAAGGMKDGYLPDLEAPKGNVLVGASISFPFFAGFRFRSMTKISTNQVSVAELGVESANAEARKNYDQALQDYISAEEKLQRFTSLIETADKALKITNSRYNNGLITSYELILAQNNLESSKMAKVQMEFQRWMAILEVNRILGTKFWN